ncbi:MAG: signal peptidase I [Armatimonadetes bacterium]|nr:signal peptidase I [Armatimonadota bacterium]MBX3109213.1 signal peptidase I [Fimbriimonadaceae bacterium]
MDLLVGQLLAQSQPGGMVVIVDKIARTPISQIIIFAVALTVIRLGLFKYLKDTPIHLRTGIYPTLRTINDLSDALIYAAVVVFMLVRPFGIQTFYIPSPSMVDTLRTNDFIVANKFIYRVSNPKFGDIIVFKPPVYARTKDQPDADFIKRCLGTPGDLIEMKDWQLYRNGKPVEEPYKTISNPAVGNELPLPKDEWQPYIDEQEDFKLVDSDVYKTTDPTTPGNPTGVIPVVFEGDIWAPRGGSRFPITWVDDPRQIKDLPAVRIPKDYYLMIGDNRNGSNDGRYWGLIHRSAIVGRAEFTWLPLARAKRLANPFH